MSEDFPRYILSSVLRAHSRTSRRNYSSRDYSSRSLSSASAYQQRQTTDWLLVSRPCPKGHCEPSRRKPTRSGDAGKTWQFSIYTAKFEEQMSPIFLVFMRLLISCSPCSA